MTHPLLSSDSIKKFQTLVWQHFNKNLRHDMPWRNCYSPYYVLVSEFMLQQTQVVRVVEYFNRFVSKWQTIESLSKASLSEVLEIWQGLGYYRRAKYLHQCAKTIVKKYGGQIPKNREILRTLPGIGEYLSAAILVFSFNMPEIVVETNIRRVVVHHFFKNKTEVDEKSIKQVVEQVIVSQNPRKWYWAFMDYGADLSSKVINPNRRTKIYKKQSPFEGSNRQVRAAILKIVLNKKNIEDYEIVQEVKKHLQNYKIDEEINLTEKVYYNVKQLTEETLLVRENTTYKVADNSN